MKYANILLAVPAALILSVSAVDAADDWTQKTPSPKPSARELHAMAYIGGDQVLLFGGDDGAYDNETWVYDLSVNTWTLKTPVGGVKPSARSGHAMAYIGGDQVLLFGGYDGACDNETWVYDLSANTWTQISPIGNPTTRLGHAMAYIGGDKVLLFGGRRWTGLNWIYYDETWVYDLSDNQWMRMYPSLKPSARWKHDVAYIGGDQVLLFGGHDGSTKVGETWVYDLSDNNWTRQFIQWPSPAPSARYGHAMAYIGGDQVLLFGGWDGARDDETWVYDLSDNAWTQDSNNSQPLARSDHRLSETSMDGSSFLVLFGGYDGAYDNETWTFGGGDYPVNDPPVITSADSVGAIEDVYFKYTATATDPDGPLLIWTFDQLPVWLSSDADSVFGTPVEGVVDTLFRVIASDGSLSDTLIVEVTVTTVNDPPVITSADSVGATEDVYFKYTATATDPDGPPLIWAFDQLPVWLSSDADSVFGTPVEGVVDTSFRVIASDGSLSDTLIVEVTVTTVNDPPVITSADSVGATEDVYFKYTATATDPDGPTLNWAFYQLPVWLSSDADSVFGTPLEGDVDTSFRAIVSDGDLGDTLIVIVTVTPVNDPPVISDIPDTSFAEDDSLSFDLDGYVEDVDDPDSALTWDVSLLEGGGVLLSVGHHRGGFEKSYRVERKYLSERYIRSKSKAAILNDELAVNPFRSKDGIRTYGTMETQEDSITVIIDPVTHIVTFMATENYFVENVPFLFTVTDDSGATDSDTMNITVTPVNDPPVLAALPDTSFAEDDSLSFDLDDYVEDVDDPDSALTWDVSLLEGGGVLLSVVHHKGGLEKSYRVGKKYLSQRYIRLKSEAAILNDELAAIPFRSKDGIRPDGIMETQEDSITVIIDPVTHIVTFMATENYFVENVPFLFTVTDDSGATDSDTMNITVTPVNDPPVLAELPDTSFAEDDSLVVYYSDCFAYVEDVDDPDSTLTWDVIYYDLISCILYPSYFVVTAPENWYGADTVSVVVMDPGGLSDTTEIIITVTPVNDPPIISDFPDSVIFRADSSIVLHLNEFVTDVDGPDSTLHWSVSGNDSVIVSINDTTNVAVLSSPLSWSGRETLFFNVMDDSSASDSDTLLVHVTPYVRINGEGDLEIPKVYSLSQNYPNPFNPITTFKYGLPKRSNVSLKIYNILGQEVTTLVDRNQEAGYHQVQWDASGFPSGIYFYWMQAANFSQVRKMLLIK